MIICVLADTHDRLPETVLERIVARRVDAIWHLGDVCTVQTLGPLEALGLPLVVVRGNNDFHPWPIYARQTLGGHRCHLIHIPPTGLVLGADVVLHGHTHVPRDESIQGVRYLNPGCITRPNRGAPRSFAWLSLDAQEGLRWELELF